MREIENASRLIKLNNMGQIKGSDIEGLLAFDVAVDPNSKLLDYVPTRKIRGNTDIILFHNFHHAPNPQKLQIKLYLMLFNI